MILAGEPSFRLGVATVSPSDCRVAWPEGRLVLQPRVMQVLVILAKASGDVVSRDTLISACWDGRVVGEDAITRVMVQLRRLASDLGGRAFELETISRVGYRLTPAPTDTAGDAAPPAGRRGLRRRNLLILGGLGVAAASSAAWLALRLRRAGREPLTVAVMPFEDLSPDAKAGPLCRGVAREVRDALARIGGLRVIADTSSSLVAAERPESQAKRLGADLLLTGSVIQSNGAVRISLELVDPKVGAQVWTQTRDGSSADLFNIFDKVSADAIQAMVGRIGPSRIAPPPRQRDPRAFLKVFEADELLGRSRELRMVGQDGPGEDAAEQAAVLANEALQIDPNDVGAHVTLANIVRNGWTRELAAHPLSQAQRASAAADIIRRALVADPNDPGALTALGDYYRRFEWRWKEAENLFRRAIGANPSLVEARWSYGYELGVLGRAKEGLAQARELFRLDPENLWRRVALARLLYLAGDRDAALKRYDIELAADPKNAFLVREVYLMHLSEGNVGALKRLNLKLRTVLWRDKPMPPAVQALSARIDAGVAALEGAPQTLLRLVDADVAAFDGPGNVAATQQGRASVDLLYIWALEYAWAGQPASALRLLQRALAAGSLYWPATLPYGPAEFPPAVRNDPRYAALWRSDPRLVELMQSRRAAALTGQTARPWTPGPDWRG